MRFYGKWRLLLLPDRLRETSPQSGIHHQLQRDFLLGHDAPNELRYVSFDRESRTHKDIIVQTTLDVKTSSSESQADPKHIRRVEVQFGIQRPLDILGLAES